MQCLRIGAALKAFVCLVLLAFSTNSQATDLRYVYYLTGQHVVVPEPHLVSKVTHVALAFLRSEVFFEEHEPGFSWPLFTTVHDVRPKFPSTTKIMVAIGGWGDTGFEKAAATAESRRKFAQNINTMVEDMGADGVDIDWEYPGGNGEDYKQVTNEEKAWEIEAYPELLAEIRAAIGPNKLMTAAVPGLLRDMLAFTNTTIPKIDQSLDFWNVMTYDLFNRRDNITKHHTGIELSLDAINAYEEGGVPGKKMNLGFAFYIKWYRTDPKANCNKNPIGCKTVLMEDPLTGADLGQAGGFSWHDPVPDEVKTSYEKAMAYGQYDSKHGGHFYWDPEEILFWSWDTPEAIARKFPEIVTPRKLGGVFAWGLGEDAERFEHLRALTEGVEKLTGGGFRDEL